MGKVIKANTPKSAVRLTELPSVGEKTEEYLRMVGILKPADLIKADPFELYVQLCKETGRRFDPCLLDQFMAASSYMKGRGKKPWWRFTEERKSKIHLIEDEIKDFRKFPDPAVRKKR